MCFPDSKILDIIHWNAKIGAFREPLLVREFGHSRKDKLSSSNKSQFFKEPHRLGRIFSLLLAYLLERADVVQQLLRDVSPSDNTLQPDANINNMKYNDQDETLQVGDRLVWHSENYVSDLKLSHLILAIFDKLLSMSLQGSQYGTVRWIGTGNSKKSDRDIMVGLELVRRLQ